MKEIEKLYKKCNINGEEYAKVYFRNVLGYESTAIYDKSVIDAIDKGIIDLNNVIEKYLGHDELYTYYPVFNAEKQTKILTWLSRQQRCTTGIRYYEGKYNITNAYNEDAPSSHDLGEAIAAFVNFIWDGFNENEKAEIKEMLEKE